MPYCPECGSEIEEDAKFCKSCGATISQGAGAERKKQIGKGSTGETSLDLSENVEAALSYILFWVTGIVFLLLEKRSKFVRFHAMQSVITFLPLMIIMWIFSIMGGAFWFGGIGWGFFSIIGTLIGLLGFILWLVLMIKAYNGEYYKLPVVGDIAENEMDRV